MNYFHTYFDDVWETLHNGIPSDIKPANCSMPPYPHSNVLVSKDTNTLTMEFALAGYSEKEVSVTANNNTVTVVVNPTESDSEVLTIHRGISRKKVNFSLAVDKAFDARKAKTSFQNGLLVLEMEKAEESQAIQLM